MSGGRRPGPPRTEPPPLVLGHRGVPPRSTSTLGLRLNRAGPSLRLRNEWGGVPVRISAQDAPVRRNQSGKNGATDEDRRLRPLFARLSGRVSHRLLERVMNPLLRRRRTRLVAFRRLRWIRPELFASPEGRCLSVPPGVAGGHTGAPNRPRGPSSGPITPFLLDESAQAVGRDSRQPSHP